MVGVVVALYLTRVASCHLVGIEVHRAGITLGGRMVGGGEGPGHGKFARRIDFTGEQVGYGVATFHAWLPGAEDGIGIAAPGGCLDDRTGVDDDDNGFASLMEGVADVLDQRLLFGDEVELCLDVAVDALTGLAADGDDGSVGGADFLFYGNRRDADLRILLLTHHLSLEPLGGMTLGLEFYAGIGDVFAVDVGELGRRLDASVLKALEHVDHIRGMHTAGTGTTGEEVVGVLSEEGDGLDFIDH